ncbi:MAG: iron ABC transporter permease [Firmicutes bacterium]|nr:iron ABC transporter permease [Bacillota bacterium]
MRTGLNRKNNYSGSGRSVASGSRSAPDASRPGHRRRPGWRQIKRKLRELPGMTVLRKIMGKLKFDTDVSPGVDLTIPGSLYSVERNRTRKRFLLALLILFLMVFIYLSFRTTVIAFLPPWTTAANLFTWIRLNVGELFHLSYYNDRRSIIAAHPCYLETTTRLTGALSIVAMGAAMSVAGVVFQSVFRNPIAVPTMLGVSSGINIGNFILVLQYNVTAASMTQERFIYGYIGSLLILFLVMGVSRLTTRDGSWAIIDVLLIGTTLTRLITQIISSIQTTFLDDFTIQLISEMNMYGAGLGNARGWIFLALALVFGLGPILLMRNSLNVVTFSEEESRVMGLNTNVMRVLALVFSTILITAAQIYCGEVGMLALLVPHTCRYLFGSNTRDLIFSSMIVGGIMMIICRFIVALTMFNQYLSMISVGMIINVISIPLMMFILLTQKRGWE